MQVIRDGILLCDDCLFAAVNGDVTGAHDHGGPERVAEIEAGLTKLGPDLVPDFDSETGKGIHEFTSSWCDCCGSKLAGSRHEFAILGDSDVRDEDGNRVMDPAEIAAREGSEDE